MTTNTAPLTDGQLLRCNLDTTALTERQWARLAVLAADQAGLPADDQAKLASTLEAYQSILADDATDGEAMDALVRTDYDNEPELAFQGRRGAAAASGILTEWSRNDRGAARLVQRLGMPEASRLYLETWSRVHATENGAES